jgi:hypothetical protein
MINNLKDFISIDQAWLEKLEMLYSTTGDFSVNNLASFYCEDAAFIDPVHETHGLQAMEAYFNRAYANLTSCRFTFTEHAQNQHHIFIAWEMKFQHPKLKGGKTISVPGTSHLQLRGDRIAYHRDHYDVGCMLYDNIPVLSAITAWLKKKLTP